MLENRATSFASRPEDAGASKARRELVALLRDSPLFSKLEEPALDALAGQLDVIELPVGATLFRKGDAGDALFLVVNGQLAVVDSCEGGAEKLLKVMGRGEHLGEIALLRHVSRTATARAETAVTLARLPRSHFQRFVAEHPGARALLARAVDQRTPRSARPSRDELLRFLAETPLFAGLDPDVLAELEPELEWMTIAAGEWLFRKDDPADALYVVLNGRLRIFDEVDDGTERSIGEAPRGQCVGEFGVLTGEPRSATVRPLRDSELLRISKSVLLGFIERHPRAMLGLVRSVVTQARASHHTRPETGGSVIAVVPSGPSVDVRALLSDLTRALAPFGSVAHTTSESARRVARDSRRTPRAGRCSRTTRTRSPAAPPRCRRSSISSFAPPC